MLAKVSASLAFALILGTTATAQVIEVRVRSDAGPLGGALVIVEDSTAHVAARVLTNARGLARIEVAAGSYQVEARAIGHAATSSRWLSVAPQGVTRIALVLTARPLALDDIVVASAPVCTMQTGRRPLLAQLWEEARTNLEVAALAREAAAVPLSVVMFERELTRSNMVLKDRRRSYQGGFRRPFTAAASEIERGGYVRKGDGESIYFAPDERVLLSDTFLLAHCFAIEASGSDTTLIGLRFDPAPGRTLPEISGTLWLRRETAELVSVAFGYANVDLPTTVRDVGGRLSFARHPSGVVFVDDWVIRMPRVVTIRSPGRSRDSLAGYKEVGGTATIGPSRPDRRNSVVAGFILDSIAGRGLAGVVVSLGGGAYADTTDDTGSYRVEVPLEGAFRVLLEHPRLDQLLLTPLYRAVALSRGKVSRLDVGLPGVLASLERLCPDDATSVDRSVVVGLLQNPSHRPVVDAEIRAGWQVVSVIGPRVRLRPVEASVATGASGEFRICGVPRGRPVVVRGPGQRPDSVILPGRRDAIAFVTLTTTMPNQVDLAQRTDDSVSGPMSEHRAAPVVVRGRVAVDSGAIEDAEVSIEPGSLRAVTAKDGGFMLVVRDPGLVRIVARKVGFHPAGRNIVLARGDTVFLDLTLGRVAQQLDPLTVVAEGSGARWLRAFEGRRRSGIGRFYDRGQLEEREHSTISSILRMTGVRLFQRPSACGGGFSAGSGRVGAMRWEGSWMVCRKDIRFPTACYYAIYVDGARYWVPGSTVPPDINRFAVRDLEAVEVYRGPAEVPIQYQTSSSTCGLVMFWSRTSGT